MFTKQCKTLSLLYIYLLFLYYFSYFNLNVITNNSNIILILICRRFMTSNNCIKKFIYSVLDTRPVIMLYTYLPKKTYRRS